MLMKADKGGAVDNFPLYGCVNVPGLGASMVLSGNLKSIQKKEL